MAKGDNKKSDLKAPVAPAYESDLRLEYTADIIAKRVAAGKKLPLEVMLGTMDTYSDQNNHAAACAIAVQAAPYVHPKLKDLVITGGDENSNPVRMTVSGAMRGLSDKELDQLDKLLGKAAGE